METWSWWRFEINRDLIDGGLIDEGLIDEDLIDGYLRLMDV